MPAIDTTLDYRSLRLPSLSSIKSRIKKPKRPSFWEILWLFALIQAIIAGVANLLLGRYWYGGLDTLYAAIYWRLYLLERAGNHERVIFICRCTIPLFIITLLT